MLSKTISDIKLRKFLNVFDYITDSSDNIYKYVNPKTNNIDISFYYKNIDVIVLGYKIKTIDGIYTIGVFGMKHIRKKKSLLDELLNENNLIDKWKVEKKKLLIKYTQLPIEIINLIVSFVR